MYKTSQQASVHNLKTSQKVPESEVEMRARKQKCALEFIVQVIFIHLSDD